ncbi:MAG: 3-phosphoshikimate 1-carboxyvinyltransferase [Planctomycetota bacterium]
MAQLPDCIEIKPVDGTIDVTIQPPGSKSITNRALLCAALAQGQSKLTGVLDSDDTRVMIGCLNELGIEVDHDSTTCSAEVTGCNGHFPNTKASLYVENSGTTIRFVSAATAIHGGQFRLHGVERMHQRPIGPLVEALNGLGLYVKASSENGCPPVEIKNERCCRNLASISGKVSSQYLSGLMMAAPLIENGLTINLLDGLVSQPYVRMTQEVMRSFGVDSELDLETNPIRFVSAPGQKYIHAQYAIEPDASAASYFWAAASICGGTATVKGLNKQALQGDICFVECLRKMGSHIQYGEDFISVSGKAKRGIDVDMSDISDTVQTLSAVALFVDGETTIRGVAHNRVKETDRIGDLATELRRLGATVQEHHDGLTITPGNLRAAQIETYQDHRMAMSLSLVGLKQPGIEILNPACTAKTYPRFFEDLQKLYES